MRMFDAQRISDLAIRHQVYLEGVKAHMFSEVQGKLDRLEDDLVKLLSRQKYKDLPSMTKAELNGLIASLKMVQGSVFGTTAGDLERMLRDFVEVDKRVLVRAWGSDAMATMQGQDSDETLEEDDALVALFLYGERIGVDASYMGAAALAVTSPLLWAKVKNAVNPGTGQTIMQMLKAWASGSQVQLEQMIRQAHANGLSTDDLVTIIAGRVKPGLIGGVSRVNLIDRLKSQLGGVVDTVVQHAAQETQAAVTSVVGRQYVWISVLDSRTTDICRSRNRKKYTYGAGPLPPAHMRCRSTIAPIVNGTVGTAHASFGAWLKTQHDSVVADVGSQFDGSTGRMQPKGLTLKQFEYKLQLLTS